MVNMKIMNLKWEKRLIKFYIQKYVQHIWNVRDIYFGISIMAFGYLMFSDAYHLQKMQYTLYLKGINGEN